MSLVAANLAEASDAEAALEQLRQAQRAALTSFEDAPMKQPLLVFAAVSTISAAHICALIDGESTLRVGALCTCVSSKLIFEDSFRSGFSQMRPCLIAQCADGWASTVIVLDSDASGTVRMTCTHSCGG